MDAAYDGVIEVACPYANCGAGVGMQCIIHRNDGTNAIRESPHAARARAADDQGLLEQTEEEAALVAELEQQIESVDQ